MANEPGSKLNEKQSLFCKEYLVDLNAAQAAIRAGYSEKTARAIGHELLTKPDLQEYIQHLMNARSERIKITADYVFNAITETIERCRQVAPVLDRKGKQVWVETPNGTEAPAFTFDAKNVLKGAELLGRHLKLFDKDAAEEGNEAVPVKVVIEVVDASKKPNAKA